MNWLASVILWLTYLLSLYFAIFFVLVFIDKKTFFDNEKNERGSLKLKKHPLISVLIPAYNEEKTVLGTLKSVLALDYPKNKLEVIVIDDGSTDQTKKAIENFIKDKKQVKLISHKNMGKAASMNKALKIARGEFFACLDADSYVERKTLKKMLVLYEKENDPDLVIVTPAMKVKKPKNILQKIQRIEYLVMIFIGRLTSQLDSLYVAPGPFSLYRTKVIKDLGGFDETSLTEDQEIAYRVQKNNYKIKQCFDGYVETESPGDFKGFYSQRRRWYKGGLGCVYRYRKMVLAKKYGDFGLIQMSKNVIGFLLAVSGIGFAFYFLLLPFLKKIYNFSFVSFDFWPYLYNFDLNINFLNFDFRKGFVVLFLFGISILFFYYAHVNVNEKVKKFGIVPLIPYFFVYYLIKGFIFLLSIAELVVKKKQKW